MWSPGMQWNIWNHPLPRAPSSVDDQRTGSVGYIKGNLVSSGSFGGEQNDKLINSQFPQKANRFVGPLGTQGAQKFARQVCIFVNALLTAQSCWLNPRLDFRDCDEPWTADPCKPYVRVGLLYICIYIYMSLDDQNRHFRPNFLLHEPQ